MNKDHFKKEIKNNLIVSCQALPNEPFYEEKFSLMPYFAKAALEGGAKALRLSSVRDIVAVKEVVNLPIIGLIKKEYQGSDVYITPTIKEVDSLVECGCDVIALDCTKRQRPGDISLQELIYMVKDKYPEQLLMADISTFDEGMTAYKLGVDFVGTTLSGYTEYSHKSKEPDFDLIKKLIDHGIDVIAEGKISTLDHIKKIQKMKPLSLVIGGAITRPKEITKRFVDVINNS